LPHYKLSDGVSIPFFAKRGDLEEVDDDRIQKMNRIAEEDFNEIEVCEEKNDFFVASRENNNKIKVGRNL